MSEQSPPRSDAAEPSFKAKAHRATLWSTAEVGARSFTQFIALVFLARILDPADFGLIALVLIFTALGTLLVDGGFGMALVQKKEVTADDETTVFCFVMAVALLAVPVFWAVAPAITRFFGHDQLEKLISVAILVLPIVAFSIVPNALLTRNLRFQERARAELYASLGGSLLAILLAIRGAGIWALVFQLLAIAALRSILLWHYVGWKSRGIFTLSALRKMFRFGGFLLAANLLDVVSVRLQALLIGKLFDSRSLGFYTIAQNTQDGPTTFLGAVLNRVGLPIFSRIADDRVRLRNALRISLQTSMFVFLPIMTALAVVADPLIIVLYGKQWADAAPILAVLAASAVLWPMHVLNLSAINAMGRSDLFFRLSIIKKTILIVLLLIFIRWGPIGVAWALLVNSTLAVIINSYFSKHFLDYGLIRQIHDQLKTIILTMASSVTAYLLLRYGAELPLAIRLATAVLTAVLIYAGGAFIISHPALARLRDLISRKS